MSQPWLALCLIFCFASPSWGEQNVNPHINQHYQNPDINQWRGIFESDGREIWHHRHDIIKALKLRLGLSVADVGTGTGFFALMMAEEVGKNGTVYAVDIAQNFVEGVLERAREAKLDNIIGVVNDQKSVHLPDASVDLIFISDTYHHFEYPVTTLKSIRTALVPGGEVVVIDYRKIPGRSSVWVMGHVRGNREQVIEEFEAQGFELIEELDLMKTQFYLRFKKTE